MLQHPLLRYFQFSHLPERLQDVSRPFSDLAHTIAAAVPDDVEHHQLDEVDAGLRKLLEAKDCIVRASLL